MQRSIEYKKILLHAEHQSSTYGCSLPPRLGLMLRCLLFSESAGLLVLSLMLEYSKNARTEPRPAVRRRILQKPLLIDGGRGETISFGCNDCRRLARRRYYLGPSIRCGAVVPARQLSKYYNLRAGHSVEAKKIVPPNPVLICCYSLPAAVLFSRTGAGSFWGLCYNNDNDGDEESEMRLWNGRRRSGFWNGFSRKK